MKRSRFSRRNKQTPDTELLIRLCNNLVQSGSRLEEGFWEARLTAAIERLLADDEESAILAALDHLYGAGGRAYDELADLVEFCCETTIGDGVDGPAGGYDSLLIAAPVLAWSRYSIPSGAIADEALSNLRVQLSAHVLARDARLGLANFLFSPDQLPQSYPATASLARRLAKTALHDRDLKVDPQKMAETMSFLSDTRYLLAVVAVPHGAPLFRWQEEDGNRQEALRQWRAQGGEALRPLLTACALELHLPQAYHAAVRDADRTSRPYAIRAAVAYLQTMLNITAADLRAVIAPYYDRQLEEYRIGFTLRNSHHVVHGVVWPLLDDEDEGADISNQIESTLRECGLHEIVSLEHRFPLEYCDDCGAPLYPDPDGEPVHAEMPEEDNAAMPRHLH